MIVDMRAGFYGCVGVSKDNAISHILIGCLARSIAEDNNGLGFREDRSVGELGFSWDGIFKEYTALKDSDEEEFPGNSPTDMLWRLLDKPQPIIEGMKSIYSITSDSKLRFAVRHQTTLYLARSEGISLHVVDMRQTLGQVFYFPTAENWRRAVEWASIKLETPQDIFPRDQVIIEFPTNQIWQLEFLPNGKALDLEYGSAPPNPPNPNWHIRKFKITRTKYYSTAPA